MRTGTEESGDDAFLPGFYPSVEPPGEAGLLSDQALREEAGTLAALSNAKQRWGINHPFRAHHFEQIPCPGSCAPWRPKNTEGSRPGHSRAAESMSSAPKLNIVPSIGASTPLVHAQGIVGDSGERSDAHPVHAVVQVRMAVVFVDNQPWGRWGGSTVVSWCKSLGAKGTSLGHRAPHRAMPGRV